MTKTPQAWEFSLVDINRISWYQHLPLSKAMASMSRLICSERVREQIMEDYAHFANIDLNQATELLKKHRIKTERYFRNKHLLRKVFPKK